MKRGRLKKDEYKIEITKDTFKFKGRITTEQKMRIINFLNIKFNL